MAFVGIKTNRKVMIEAQLPRVSPENRQTTVEKKGSLPKYSFCCLAELLLGWRRTSVKLSQKCGALS